MKATTPNDFRELELWKKWLQELKISTISKIDLVIHRINCIEAQMKYKGK